MSLRNIAMAGAMMALLAGCVSVVEQPLPQTPKQSWGLAKGSYAIAATMAAEYRVQCGKKPSVLQVNCMKVVQVLREIDSEAEEIESYGDYAFVSGDGDLLAFAIDGMERLQHELEAELAKNMIEERKP